MINLLSTIKGYMLESFFPAGWDLEQWDECIGDTPEVIFNRREQWNGVAGVVVMGHIKAPGYTAYTLYMDALFARRSVLYPDTCRTPGGRDKLMQKEKQQRVLAVMAHPDDIEILVDGTVLHHGHGYPRTPSLQKALNNRFVQAKS